MKKTLINLLYRLAIFDALHVLQPKRITVLAYHRIDDTSRPDFDTFKLNVSASPEVFAGQLAYIQKRFNVISVNQLADWLQGKAELPRFPLVITFDDGYTDNLTNAYPLLKQYNFPAVIFLATSCIGSKQPFLWDLIAYCFAHTSRRSAKLPVLGERAWAGDAEKDGVIVEWLNAIKWLPDEERWSLARTLPDILEVPLKEDAFEGLYMTWEQARMLVDAGIDMGAHTVAHPILTRVSKERVRVELVESKGMIEEKTGKKVRSFAYPNGLESDFNAEIEELLCEEGIEVAFTLLPGPSSPKEARANPYEIRRVYIGRRDTMPRFAAKLCGFARFFGRD